MNFNPNGLFFTMARLFKERVGPDTKLIVGNEGSSRSSKTWDTFHFLVALCDHNRGNPLEIYVLRDTLVNCRDFTLEEFKKCLIVIGIYEPKCLVHSPKPVYNLWGHKIKFRGMDDEQASEGYPSDVLFFNEVLEQSKTGVAGLIMRCRKMAIMDWNPKYTDHWVFDMERRPDTVFTRTTYKNNRHLDKSIVSEIESYDPSKPENVAAKTADAYRWTVYGLGQRCNREGLVFPEVTWIDKFPTKIIEETDSKGKKTTRVVDDVDAIGYGIDFGMTNQTAVVKGGAKYVSTGKPHLYLQKLFYAPTETSDIIIQVLKSLNMETHGWCDNNLPAWIGDIRAAGINVFATHKFKGSREYWITTLKRFHIHIVKDPDFRKEQENFSYRVVDGKQLSETIKAFDHLWSASGYMAVGDFRYLSEPTAERRE